ncbi:MAG: PhoH family protein [Deltaproteobacteria bacterium]|jgi:phosphate starvation-inducible PhoH-like protein|nr:PhoH family protein [Deltaproteobacteria bacterium]
MTAKNAQPASPPPASARPEPPKVRLSPRELGPNSVNLKILAEILGFQAGQRGGEIILNDPDPQKVLLAQKALWALTRLPASAEGPSPWEASCLGELVKAHPDLDLAEFWDAPPLRLGEKSVRPKNPAQKAYLERIRVSDLTFGLGPAGVGKTFLAVAMAAAALLEGAVQKIILARPAVEAGERLGFLPGDLAEKIDPYLRPLFDALSELTPAEKFARFYEKRQIEVAPLAFMRGRTLSKAFVILDEAQNASREQMKMFLTRLGPGSKAVVTGDPGQSDLSPRVPSGLKDAQKILVGIPGVSFCFFEGRDAVRHRLVARIVEAYGRAGF